MTRYFASFFAVALLLLPLRAPNDVVFAQIDAETANVESLDFPILFSKQHNYQGLHIYDAFFQFRPGGGIYVLENPSAPKEERRVRAVIDATTPETLGEGVYSSPSLSYDAKKIVFAFKGTANGNTELYEIGIDGTGLRKVVGFESGCNAYCGSGKGWHDVQPSYLPDGRIVFTSTRYSGLVPCANNGVAVLFVVNPDGSDLHTISVNNVTEFNPTVLDDGRILFGRWEYIDKNALTIQSLWTVLPDGINETALYSNNMVFPEAILQARQVPGNPELVVGTFAGHNGPPRGAIAMVDVSGDKNDENAIFNFEYHDVPTFDRGQSCDPWALNENVVLYSGMISDPLPTARPTDPGQPERIGAVLPQPQGQYNSLLLIDRSGKRVEVLHDDSIDLHTPIPVVPRVLPRLAPETVDREQKVGRFFVNDVYKGLSGVERGAVKWLRVIEETSRVTPSPGNNGLNQTFSISAALAWSPKIYLGIVPVKEDGSVYFEAPSGRAVYFQLLDENYRMIRGMRTFIQAAPGVTRSCVGCHEYGPPELTDSGATRYPKDAVEKLRDESWGSGYLDYPSQIQPIWDARCVSCHGGERLAAGLDLSGAPTRLFNISYENLTSRRRNQYQVDLIAGVCCMNGTAYYSCKFFEPYEHGSGKAPLADMLLNDPVHKDLLTREERELVFTWIDSNGIYYGTWDYTASGPILTPIEEAKRELVALMNAPESGCSKCHADSRRFENDWINIANPEASRILRAPLAKRESDPKEIAGLALCRDRAFPQDFLRLGIMSNGQYEHAVKELRMFPTQEWRDWDESGEPACSFDSRENETYRKALAIIEKARAKALSNPRIDMPNAYEAPGGIVEGRSRQITPQQVPDYDISFEATVAPNGVVRLNWERSARTIGLAFELRRFGGSNDPVEGTLLTRTERFNYVDAAPPSGKIRYEVTPISDPESTCGTYRVSAENQTNPAFKLVRGRAVSRDVEIGEDNAPDSPVDLQAKSGVEEIELTWKDARSDGLSNASRYVVTRQIGCGVDSVATLTPSPIYGTSFVDKSAPAGVDCVYSVEAVSARGTRSAPGVCTGRAIAAPKLELFSAPYASNVNGVLSDGQETAARTVGTPTISDGALVVGKGSYVAYPYRAEYNAKRRFTLEFDVQCDAPGVMPVIVSNGSWNKSGWFLQRFNGKIRFHFGGVDCDATEDFPVGKEIHVVATYDGSTLRIAQDGRLVGERVCRPIYNDWTGELFVGQYSADQSERYQFYGKIRNLKILNYIR
ncbi:MAG: hypothetical protein IK077_17385 [Thermoguttaceae bacterium]|nr:hypothetical protein [Thermoguttaceae bacterium]